MKQRATGFDLFLPHNPAKVDKHMSKSFGKKCGSLSCPKNILKVKQRAAGFDLVLPHNPAKIDKQMRKTFGKNVAR